jgi:hypothetical protein
VLTGIKISDLPDPGILSEKIVHTLFFERYRQAKMLKIDGIS